VSQLGYMFLAHGVHAYSAGIFHLVTHAFFKALMFLGAGAVMHALGGETDMRKMGGLRKLMPVTGWTFMAGWLAISGVVPFAGFFSKDAIIETAFAAGGVRGLLLGGAALLGAGITAFYMTRVMLMTFFGERRWKARASEATGELIEPHPHESPGVMTAPMAVLAVGSVGAGALLAIGGTLEHWLEPVVGAHEVHHVVPVWVMTIITLSVVAVGVGIAYRMYATRPIPETAPTDVSALTVAARNDLYGDAFNEDVFMRSGQHVTAGLVEIDDDAIDGVSRGLGAVVGGSSQRLGLLQTGFARSYALSMFAGAALVVAAVLVVRVW
jgi:NADH-quinone oxidoreductase subunit L